MVSVHHDNPTLFDTKAFEWTPEGIRYRASLAKMGGSNLARMCHGLWQTAQGAVFPSFERTRHCSPSFDVPDFWPGYLAEDPGFDHPTAIAVAVIAPNGRLWFVREFVRSQTTTPEDAAWIRELERQAPYTIRRKLGDPHYMFSEDKKNNGVSVATQMRAEGHSFERAPAASNGAQLEAQVQLIRSLLDKTLDDGGPAVMFFEDECPSLINAMESHPFKRNARGERKGAHDEYSELYKDEIDAIRMIVSAMPEFEHAAPVAITNNNLAETRAFSSQSGPGGTPQGRTLARDPHNLNRRWPQ